MSNSTMHMATRLVKPESKRQLIIKKVLIGLCDSCHSLALLNLLT